MSRKQVSLLNDNIYIGTKEHKTTEHNYTTWKCLTKLKVRIIVIQIKLL
jgi:hypothetical protein